MLKFEAPNFDGAIVGITEDDRLIYNFSAMVDLLVERDGMTPEDAIEFIDYNTVRALPYYKDKGAPVIMFPCSVDYALEYMDEINGGDDE